MIDATNYQKAYIDLDMDMKRNEVSNDVRTKTGVNAISQSIKNILLTSSREKPFTDRPWFGMYEYLFSNENSISSIILAAAIQSLEPRVTVNSDDIEITTKDDNSMTINIKYKIKSPISSDSNFYQTLTLKISGEDDGR